MKNKKKQIIITLVAIISLIVITVGVTYAFFNYAKEGTTDNTIQTGSITFLYTEVSGVGKGISLTEAYPVADSIGKVQVGEGKVFDFKVTSNIEMTINKGKPILKACLYMFIHIILHILSKDLCRWLVLLKGWLFLRFCRHSLCYNDISFPMGLHILLNRVQRRLMMSCRLSRRLSYY